MVVYSDSLVKSIWLVGKGGFLKLQLLECLKLKPPLVCSMYTFILLLLYAKRLQRSCRVITDSVELFGSDFPDARVRAGDDGDLAVQPGLARAFTAEHVFDYIRLVT